MAKIYRAIEPFAYTDKGGIPRIVTPGDDPVAAGHPLLKGKEHLFREVTVSEATETATAGPGEKRARAYTRSKSMAESSDEEKKGNDDGE